MLYYSHSIADYIPKQQHQRKVSLKKDCNIGSINKKKGLIFILIKIFSSSQATTEHVFLRKFANQKLMFREAPVTLGDLDPPYSHLQDDCFKYSIFIFL